MYSESLSIIMEVEAHLIGEKLNQYKILSYLQRLIWFPLKFLKIGISEKAKGISTYTFIAFAFLVLVGFIVSNSELAKTEFASILLLFAEIVPIFLVVFAMPSTYAHSGIDEHSVSFVKQYLFSRGFSTETQIDILKKSLKPIEDKSRERVVALKWLVGLVWAGFIYNLSKESNLSKLTQSEILAQMKISVGLAFALIAAYFCVWGYEASLDKLFRTIEFGSNDFVHENYLTQSK
jgi:hypothetical protein